MQRSIWRAAAMDRASTYPGKPGDLVFAQLAIAEAG